MDEADDQHVRALRPRHFGFKCDGSVRPDAPLYGKSATMMFVDETMPRTGDRPNAPDRAEIGHLATPAQARAWSAAFGVPLGREFKPRYRFVPAYAAEPWWPRDLWVLVGYDESDPPRFLRCQS